MFDITYTLTKIWEILPQITLAFFLTIILTPLVGKLAFRLKAIDEPIRRRLNNDEENGESDAQTLPRLGGLAIYLVFMIFMFYSQGFNTFTVSLGLGLTVLTIGGIIDDIHNLSGASQILFQILAVVIVVLGGSRVLLIDVLGHHSTFDAWTTSFIFLGQTLSIVMPADLITIFWFLIIINAMNWVAGIDALEETMSWVAGITLMLLAIKFGETEMFILTAIFSTATIAFWMFNFPPAKILGGSVANTILGFLLAVFSIKIDGKLTTAVLLLALPLVDFFWVLAWRLVKFREFNPLKLMAINGKHHLHHRLIEMGYSKKQTLWLEMSIYSFFALLAYYLSGFNIMAVAFIGSLVGLFSLFTIITIILKKRREVEAQQKGKIVEQEEGIIVPKDPEKPPESVYAY